MEIAKAGTEGLPIRPAMGDELPEFVRTYSAWLESSFGVAPGDEIRIAMYAHASNGGIAIDANARTGVPGLFAAGECTGGMHGADRLGGLSSANGLVFGMRAGRSAAAFAEQVPNDFDLPAFPRWTCVGSESWREVEAMLKQTMDTSCSIARAGDSLEDAGYELQSLSAKLTAQVQVCDANLAAMTRKTRLRIETANAIVQAAFAREASLGSHCRVDAT